MPDRELEFLLGVNPRLVWLVVVFVAGLSLGGHVLGKVLNPARAVGVVGLLVPVAIAGTAEASRMALMIGLVTVFSSGVGLGPVFLA